MKPKGQKKDSQNWLISKR